MSSVKMEPLVSSNLHSAGHDGDALYIRFRGAGGAPGRLYRYPTADKTDHAALMGALSPGQHFARVIRHAHKGHAVEE